MATEAIGSNMHMDTRVMKVADFKYGSYDLRGCLEAAKASETVRGNQRYE